MEVFNLMPGQDHPLYGRLSFGLQPSLFGNEYLFEDFDGIDVGKLSWMPNRFARVWTIKQARGTASLYNDYPADGSLVSFFSARAVEALRDFLEPNGELLPVDTKAGPYFAYNILTKSTALDLTRTEAFFGEQGEGEKETAFSIDRFEFDETKLINHTIFRIRVYPPVVYVTDAFKQRAETAGLNGMFFYKVWPLASNEDWKKLRKQQWIKIREEWAHLAINSLFIQMPVAKKEASEQEAGLVEAISEDLGEYLAIEHNKTIPEFVGQVMRLEETRGALRIGLVTPDVDRLAEIVAPWMSTVEWPGAIELIKRYGTIDDSNAKSKKVKLH